MLSTVSFVPTLPLVGVTVAEAACCSVSLACWCWACSLWDPAVLGVVVSPSRQSYKVGVLCVGLLLCTECSWPGVCSLTLAPARLGCMRGVELQVLVRKGAGSTSRLLAAVVLYGLWWVLGA